MKNNVLEILINYLPYLQCYSLAVPVLINQGKYFVGHPGEV